jgi:ribonuclease HI
MAAHVAQARLTISRSAWEAIGGAAMHSEGVLDIYTDGSSYSSPRAGGVGIVFVLIDEGGNELVQKSTFPGYRGATSNQMELQAPILALREARRLGLANRVHKIVIHTDSTYVCDNYKRAMFEWPKTRWAKRGGAPVLNAELWKDLVKAMRSSGCIVEFQWVKGHAKDPHNKAVDKLAKLSAKRATLAPLTQVSVRRKRTSEKVEPGGVLMVGQRMSIRVITCEYLRVQHVWRYKYEVLSKRSPFFGRVDWIHSAEDLLVRDGHSYHVRLNEDQSYPQIAKVFRELAG